jgi:hypothetical protein
VQTIPSLGIALPATRSPDPRPPTGESSSSFAEYLRTIDGRRSSPTSDKSSPTDSDENTGTDKEQIAAEADRRRARTEEEKATKESTTAGEQRAAKRVAKRPENDADEQPIEDVHTAAATKMAAVREHSEIHEEAVQREAAAVAGESERKSIHTDERNDTVAGDSGKDRAGRAGRADHSGKHAGAGNRPGKNETVARAGSDAGKSGKPGKPGTAERQPDASSSVETVQSESGEAAVVDQDGTVKTGKEHATATAGASVDQQTVSGIAGKNGAVGAERGHAKVNRLEERSGRVRSKSNEAGRAGESRGEVKNGEGARGGDETRKRIVADIEVNLREESGRDGTLKGDTALSDAGDHRGGAAETDSASFLTRLEHAPNTPTQRQGTAQQAAGTLARRLNGDLGTNIVRQAKVMLKEADQAEIRLIIRPPELGRVRINMHMENGHIAGKILVDNGSVREAVEQNLAALQRAFEEAGLEVGDFEVSTGDSRDEAADDRATPSHSGANRRRNGAGQFAESVEPVVVNDYSHRRINLVA